MYACKGYMEYMNYCPTCKKRKALEIIKNKQVEIRWVIGNKPTIDSTYGLTDEELSIVKKALL